VKVFVAGATGVIGRPLVRRLLAEEHDVVGITRSEAKAQDLRNEGIGAIVCNAFDCAGLARAVQLSRPDVIVHLLTDIPKAIDPKRYAEQMAGNDLLRREGTRNLIAAARRAGVRRLVAESIAFAYAPVGGPVKEEDDSLDLEAQPPFRATVEAVSDLEEQVLLASGLQGLVLRFGYLYGPGTVYAADGQVAQLVLRRRFPIVGDGEGVYSFLHVEDAAGATVRALSTGTPGIYNVVDDQPATVREWLPVYAAALGAPRPRRVPVVLARMLSGSFVAGLMTEGRGASNRKARVELRWEPTHPTWRTGFEASLR
jgi:nucleoside-diphosphate-sugar epimerase